MRILNHNPPIKTPPVHPLHPRTLQYTTLLCYPPSLPGPSSGDGVMATGAADGHLFRSVFEGCIAGGDAIIEHRPYHKNCRCALHKPRGGAFSHAPLCGSVSYPIRRSWSDGCLALAAETVAAAGRTSSSSSPSTSAREVIGIRTRLRSLGSEASLSISTICEEDE